jgi:hypothetical protein
MLEHLVNWAKLSAGIPAKAGTQRRASARLKEVALPMMQLLSFGEKSVTYLGVAGLLLTMLALSSAVKAEVVMVAKPVAVLRALDKITARVEELAVPVGRPYKFGSIIVTVQTCRATPPEETPESAAFIEVTEAKPDKLETKIFSGWMFASSPALSALEHPVYDVWVTGCKDADK